MARAVWVALAFAALASGARYVDYSGVKMPEYGGGLDYEAPRDSHPSSADDYHGLGASANLDDYKYEEDSVKTVTSKEVLDSEEWQKPVKNQRKSLGDPNLENFYKYSTEESVPKFKASNRKRKQSRTKHRMSDVDDVITKRPIRHGRYRKDDLIDVDGSVERNVDEFLEDDEEKLNYNYHRQTTSRIVRRKPRDRYMMPGSDVEEDMIRNKLMKSRIKDRNYRPDDFRARGVHRRKQSRLGSDSADDTDIYLDPEEAERKANKLNDYSDYYDMKRVQGIKEKLPALIRRTTTIQRVEEPPYRRMMAPIPERDYGETTETETDTNVEISTTTTTTTSTTTTYAPASTYTIDFGDRFTQRLRAMNVPKNVTLSYAEKSRLSILKKAQKKEMIKGEGTSKPPVLIQVTDKVHTLVIIEPPTSEMPWKRAREVSDDTPEQLKKVKRMMRSKLVNNAKNIRDLTENWDDMVCDYIDVSLLKSSASGTNIQDIVLFLTCVCFIILIEYY